MQSVPINASASGDNTLVASVPGRRIRVMGYALSFSGTVNAQFTDGAGGSALAGLFYGAAGGNVKADAVPPVMGSQPGWFATSQGNALVLNLSAAVAVGGVLLVDYVP